MFGVYNPPVYSFIHSFIHTRTHPGRACMAGQVGDRVESLDFCRFVRSFVRSFHGAEIKRATN